MNKGKIIIICGPSGVGKGTIIKGLLKLKKLKMNLVKSYTTRVLQKRDQEIDNHIHISRENFLKKIKLGEFAETNFYNGNYYGTLKKDLINIIKNDKLGILEQNLDKALLTKKNYINVIIIFIISSVETIRQRLIQRHENSKEQIKQRLKIARAELVQKEKADYIVNNLQNFPEKAIEEIEKIIIQSLTS